MSFSCEALETPKALISLMTSTFLIWLKVKIGTGLVFFYIAKMQRCLQYFCIAFKVGSLAFSKFESP